MTYRHWKKFYEKALKSKHISLFWKWTSRANLVSNVVRAGFKVIAIKKKFYCACGVSDRVARIGGEKVTNWRADTYWGRTYPHPHPHHPHTQSNHQPQPHPHFHPQSHPQSRHHFQPDRSLPRKMNQRGNILQATVSYLIGQHSMWKMLWWTLVEYCTCYIRREVFLPKKKNKKSNFW